MATKQGELTSTILEFIESYIVEPLTIDSFMLKQVLTRNDSSKFVVPGDNLIIRYMDELKSGFHTVTMSDEEFAKYKYRPKLLSYDVYGTTEMWWLILMINEIPSATQFDRQTLTMMDTTVKDKLERILTLNDEIIKANDDATRDTLQDK